MAVSVADIVARATAPLRKGVTADLAGLVIEEPLDLSGATLGNLDFSGTTFKAPVAIRGATFAGIAWFKGCEFHRQLDLSQSVFCNDLRLGHAVMHADAALSRAELRGVCELDHARFEARADLDAVVVFGNMSLDSTVFSGPVTLQGSDFLGGLWCERAQFLNRADFRGVEVHGRTWLKHANLGGAVEAGTRNGARDIQSWGYRWS